MSVAGIASIWYPVSDWEAAKRFYCETLGLPLLACDDAAGWAALSAGDGAPPFFLVRKPADHPRGAVVGFQAQEAHAVMQRLNSAGARIDSEVQQGDGVRIFTAYDPDGNAIEIVTAPEAPA